MVGSSAKTTRAAFDEFSHLVVVDPVVLSPQHTLAVGFENQRPELALLHLLYPETSNDNVVTEWLEFSSRKHRKLHALCRGQLRRERLELVKTRTGLP